VRFIAWPYNPKGSDLRWQYWQLPDTLETYLMFFLNLSRKERLSAWFTLLKSV